jgi:glutathione S-transferase
MSRYEIVYFDIRGRAEPIRMLLALAGQAFVDTRLTFETWPAHKPKAPLGQAPILVVRDGHGERHIPQSKAILRHLARAHGLYGADEVAMTAVDVAQETASDLRTVMGPLLFGPGAKDADAKAKFVAEQLPAHLGRLVKLLGEQSWFAGQQPTLADVLVYDALESLDGIDPHALDAPVLAAFMARFRAIPAIAGYLEGRSSSGR